MAFRRVTMQDVANACGLSRNTVSKIFNDRGAVPDSTKQMVLKKAQEMGYLSLSVGEAAKQEAQNKNIILLTCRMPTNYHFGTFFIPAFARTGRFAFSNGMTHYTESPHGYVKSCGRCRSFPML